MTLTSPPTVTAVSEIRLCGVEEVKRDQPHKVALDGRDPVAVFRVEDDFYVTDDVCTHGQASLSEDGELDGFTILCSWHDGAFDIRTGEVKARPCVQPLRVYPVSVRDAGVYITL